MMTTPGTWFFWAALSARFAALAAIFAKIGIQGVDSDYATLIRTVITVFVLAPFGPGFARDRPGGQRRARPGVQAPAALSVP